MFTTFNYFRQYNDNRPIDDNKEFYKKFSNEREFGSYFRNIDHLIKNRFMNTFGFVNNIILRRMPRNILDIGCGNGVNLPFSNLYPYIEYEGVDYAEKSVQASEKQFPNAKIQVMDAFNLSYKKNKFDLAILSSVLILYKSKNDRHKLLMQASRVLNDNGILIAIIWKDSLILKYSIYLSRLIARLKKIPLPKDFNGVHFTESEAVKMFEYSGFKVLELCHTAVEYGILESVRYITMKKYLRDFKSREKEAGKIYPQNNKEDLILSSGSPVLTKLFYFVSNYFPQAFSMFSIYVLEKK